MLVIFHAVWGGKQSAARSTTEDTVGETLEQNFKSLQNLNKSNKKGNQRYCPVSSNKHLWHSRSFLLFPLPSAAPCGYHFCSCTGLGQRNGEMHYVCWCLCLWVHPSNFCSLPFSGSAEYLLPAVVGYKGRAAVLLGRCMEACEPCHPSLQPSKTVKCSSLDAHLPSSAGQNTKQAWDNRRDRVELVCVCVCTPGLVYLMVFQRVLEPTCQIQTQQYTTSCKSCQECVRGRV